MSLFFFPYFIAVLSIGFMPPTITNMRDPIVKYIMTWISSTGVQRTYARFLTTGTLMKTSHFFFPFSSLTYLDYTETIDKLSLFYLILFMFLCCRKVRLQINGEVTPIHNVLIINIGIRTKTPPTGFTIKICWYNSCILLRVIIVVSKLYDG